VTSTLLPFLAVGALVIVVPGQDTALTIRNTLAGGRRAGIATAFGVSCGQAIWAVATSLGLAALLVASEPVYLALKALGAAYLLWLGAWSIWRALRAAPHLQWAGAAGPRTPATASFRQGLVSNLGNPKMAVFFTSLLPQFTGTNATFASSLGLGLLFSLLTLMWLSLYAFAIARASRVFDRPSVRRVLDAVTGTVLVALGIRLLASGGKTA
jgi:threonine/homoserine/homoserine lactone efflux protein